LKPQDPVQRDTANYCDLRLQQQRWHTNLTAKGSGIILTGTDLMIEFSNDNGIEYDDNEIVDDDEILDADNDNEPEYGETEREGGPCLREKHRRTVDHTTVTATATDADILPVAEPDPQVEDEAETILPRKVSPAIVKQQSKARLNAAVAQFGKLPKLPKEPANDNRRQTVSWPLMDQLQRRTFEPDEEIRLKLIATARYVRELINTVEADSLGESVHLLGNKTSTDYAFQRTDSGKAFFENGQTLDRKKVIYDTKNGEADAERHSGSVRTASKSGTVSNSGFDPHRDDPFPVRVMAAREELHVVIAFVGPLWPSLLATLDDNFTLTEVGQRLGSKSGVQASGVGTVIIRLALMAALEAIDTIKGIDDRRPTPMPDKSRGSFRNQTRGPVIKIAA
jgi:hypothetical protein